MKAEITDLWHKLADLWEQQCRIERMYYECKLLAMRLQLEVEKAKNDLK